MPKPTRDLLGMSFDRLTVTGRAAPNARGAARWHCVCRCGKTSIVLSGNLLQGLVRSCGCLRDESAGARFRTHGLRSRPEYTVWKSMRGRVTATSGKYHRLYVLRGITVCERWNDFALFLADMGPRPPKSEIERIDNDGNYEPANCRWATRKEQTRNRSVNILITFNGETRCLGEWCDRLNLSYSRTYKRLKDSKWPVEKAFQRQRFYGGSPARL